MSMGVKLRLRIDVARNGQYHVYVKIRLRLRDTLSIRDIAAMIEKGVHTHVVT